LAKLEDALIAASEIDLIVKGLRRGDAWRELGRLALAVANAGAELPRGRTRGRRSG
jgi:hypothetical protein